MHLHLYLMTILEILLRRGLPSFADYLRIYIFRRYQDDDQLTNATFEASQGPDHMLICEQHPFSNRSYLSVWRSLPPKHPDSIMTIRRTRFWLRFWVVIPFRLRIELDPTFASENHILIPILALTLTRWSGQLFFTQEFALRTYILQYTKKRVKRRMDVTRQRNEMAQPK